MTDDLDIYEKIAAAVAEGREPDLSSFAPSQVRRALERVLGFPVPRRDFVAWLNGRVQTLTGGRASVEERSADNGSANDAGAQPLSTGESVQPLAVLLIVEGEPFAEPAVLGPSSPVLRFTMRG